MTDRKEAIDADVATPAEIENLLNALEQATGQSQTELEIKRLREIVYRYVDPFDVTPEDKAFVQAAQRAAQEYRK